MNPTKLFIERANKIHHKKYDYSKVQYVNANTGVLIMCPVHGDFIQRPYVHINRKGSCPRCGYEQRAKSKRKNNNWWDYDKAKQFVNNLQLTNISDWNDYCTSNKKPTELPSCPKVTYNTQWEGWERWIGVNARTKNFMSFFEARKKTRKYGLRSYEDWIHFCRIGNRPNDIPFNPKIIYNTEWVSWSDWLGFTSRANGNLPGVVYIIQQDNLPDNVYKIGRTYRLDKRLYEHQRINNSKIIVLRTFNVDNMALAETKIHKIALSLGQKYKYNRSKEHFEIDNIQQLIMLFE